MMAVFPSVRPAMCTAALALLAGPLAAQEVTLKLHEFLPAGSTVPREIVHVWADKIEEESQNRIKIDRFSGMALGGAPPELMDQTIDGVTDIAWTVVGYTPGRFPQTEVFELPFQLRDGAEASCAFWTMYEEHMTEDFADVKVLGTWVHGPGVIHSAEPVETPADLDGLKVRGGSRIVNEVLEAAGATPVGMPVPAVPEALSKGVIDATTIPWEVTGSLKTSDLVEYHTEFEGEWLYTLTFVMVMNKDVFAGLPADLQAVIEENSGLDFSIFAGKTQQAFDAPEREVAVENGNEIFLVTETGPWTAAVTPIIADWVADMSEIGVDGQALIDQSQALMAGQCAGADADL